MSEAQTGGKYSKSPGKLRKLKQDLCPREKKENSAKNVAFWNIALQIRPLCQNFSELEMDGKRLLHNKKDYRICTSITRIIYLVMGTGERSIFAAISEVLEWNSSLFETVVPPVPLLFIFLAGTPAIEIPFS